MAAGFAPPKLKDFILTEKLGSGTYATVYKAFRKTDSREAVAVKVVSKKSLNKSSMENLLTEIEILKTVRHPHIVQLKDFQVQDSQHLVMCALLIRMRRHDVSHVCVLACALQFLHEKNISHLDLKPQNILLSGNVLKLADFGFAQYMSPWDEQQALRGSPLYMAPEMVCRRHYDARVDLWSVGFILYKALFGRAPFASRSFAKLEEKIRTFFFFHLLEMQDLLLLLLFFKSYHHQRLYLWQTQESLVLQAVQKDQDGERSAALSLYCSALEHFVPAIHYETDRQRKEALRQKVNQYVSRAEELKALVRSDNKISFEEAKSTRNILICKQDQPRFLAALEVASTAVARKESGAEDYDTLDLYQQSLGELLLALAGNIDLCPDFLLQIKSLMSRAEYLKELIKMRETQTDESLKKDAAAESVRSCKFRSYSYRE
uniref:Serine/threonine-protein kinase ULK3 n=1 Tax=Sinocyclocheilus rhinocerous TaxID=307959 RepID=A0A673GMF6_9TELE